MVMQQSPTAPRRARKNPTSRMEFPVARRTKMSPAMLEKVHRSAWCRSSAELVIIVGDQCYVRGISTSCGGESSADLSSLVADYVVVLHRIINVNFYFFLL